MDHNKTAAAVLQGVGGAGNISSVVHCATRLRFVVKDRAKVDDASIRATAGVLTTADGGGQYQVVIGNEVPEVYAALTAATGTGTAVGSSGHPDDEPKRSILNRFISTISEIFTPILWALAGTGLLKALVATALMYGWLTPKTTTTIVLSALSDAFIFFLPLALAISAAKFFKAQQFTSLAVAGALVYPSIVALNGAPGLDFFGMPLTMVAYTSSVIPIIVVVWLQSHVERVLYKWLPAAVRRFLTPMLIVALFVPLTLLVIGPLSSLISNGLSGGVAWVFATVPWLGGALIGGLWQVLVVFGLHWSFIPLFVIEYQATGYILLLAPVFAAKLGQTAATAAVWARTKDKTLKSLAAPATLSGLLAGVTEPALYGVNLPLKRPYAIGLIGGAIGGAIVAAGGVASNSFALASLLSLPSLLGRGSTTLMIIGISASMVISFVLTFLFGVPRTTTTPLEDGSASPVVQSPITGQLVAMSDVPDPVFASGALGQGIAIKPTDGTLYAPFDGTVVTVLDTGHAVGLKHPSGAEMLIHVGIDTVKLEGKHFTTRVSAGQQVAAGDVLLTFDRAAIEAAGYSTITPVLVLNGNDFEIKDESEAKTVEHGTALFSVVAKQKVPV